MGMGEACRGVQIVRDLVEWWALSDAALWVGCV